MKATKLLLTTLLLLTFFSFAAAADRTVTGNISVAETGGPLPGTQILIKGTFTGTVTDSEGNYVINIAVDEVTFIITFIGFKTQEITLAPGVTSLDIEMEEDVLKTSGVVVTGLATSVKKRNLAHSVATISADELVPTPVQTLGGALAGKFAGVNVSQNTGAPGGGISVNLRGVSTLEGSTQPLYVVDGVIINNRTNLDGLMDLITAAASAGSPRPQGQPVNRVADINPNDIANIEVLKGASAAAMYGSKAANGVVIITTKSGTSGKTKISFSQQVGQSSILKKLGHREWTRTSAGEVWGDPGLAAWDQNIETRGIGLIDYEDELYGETGTLRETIVSARGGTNKTQFYVSGMFKDDKGIIKNTGYKKYSAKVNVKHRFSEKAKLDVYTSMLRTESDRAITGNDNTNTTFGFSLAFTPSFLDIRKCNEADVEPGSSRIECYDEENPLGLNAGDYPDHPFNPSNPLHTRDLLINNEVVFRTITSAKLTYSLFRAQNQKLDFIVQGGADFFSQENKAFSPPELQYEKNSGQPGSSILGEVESINSNLYLNLVHKYITPSNISYNTTVGWQYEDSDVNNLLLLATNLVVTQQNIDQASNLTAFQEITRQRELGFFLQEEVNINDRIYTSFGIRGDRSSTLGDTEDYFYYPKLAGSFRLTEDVKLRAAFGKTGNLPRPRSKFTALNPINIGGSAGLISASTRGFDTITPETTSEIEIGTDLTFLDENGTVEFSYFKQTITDLLLTADLPSSSGFLSEIVNAGEMETNGIELSVAYNVLRGQNSNWLTRVNFYKTSSEITKLNVDEFNTGGFATSLGAFRIEEGLSPTTLVGLEKDADGKHIELGNETPDFQMSFNNSLRFGGFHVGFLLDWKKGGDVINLGKLLTDFGGTSSDYDEMGDFIIPSTDGSDSAVTMINGEGRIAAWLGGKQTAGYIEDGSYIKLRELSLSYSFSEERVKSLLGGRFTYLKLGISGRNLWMSTDYLGYDPEVSQFGSVAIGRSVDTIPYPTARSFFFNISLGM